MNEFSGSWVRRGSIMVPVVAPEPVKVTCRVCGGPSPVGLCRPCRDSSRQRVHGTHAGFAQHVRRNEVPCQACSDAEKAYQGARYRKGSLSPTDRAWCERAAVKSSWELDTRHNRRASVANNLERTTTMKRYQIVGYLNGESHYYRRNVAEDSVQDEMNEARAEGWTGVQAVVEAF